MLSWQCLAHLFNSVDLWMFEASQAKMGDTSNTLVQKRAKRESLNYANCCSVFSHSCAAGSPANSARPGNSWLHTLVGLGLCRQKSPSWDPHWPYFLSPLWHQIERRALQADLRADDLIEFILLWRPQKRTFFFALCVFVKGRQKSFFVGHSVTQSRTDWIQGHKGRGWNLTIDFEGDHLTQGLVDAVLSLTQVAPLFHLWHLLDDQGAIHQQSVVVVDGSLKTQFQQGMTADCIWKCFKFCVSGDMERGAVFHHQKEQGYISCGTTLSRRISTTRIGLVSVFLEHAVPSTKKLPQMRIYRAILVVSVSLSKWKMAAFFDYLRTTIISLVGLQPLPPFPIWFRTCQLAPCNHWLWYPWDSTRKEDILTLDRFQVLGLGDPLWRHCKMRSVRSSVRTKYTYTHYTYIVCLIYLCFGWVWSCRQTTTLQY